METTIKLDGEIKKRLDLIKIHPRESYNDVIARILGNTRKPNEESLIETIDVLSDPETIRDIAEALEDYERGNHGTSWEKIKKDLKLNVRDTI